MARYVVVVAARYGQLLVYGPFKRLASGTQTPDDMTKIVRSGELWGGPPAYRPFPAAQAYHGTLQAGESGFEFYSHVPPDGRAGPPHWRERPDGSVWVADGKARVKIYVSRVTMRLA